MNMNNNSCCGSCGAWLYTVFRIVVGGLFMWHGIAKFMMGPSAVAGFLSVSPWMAWTAAILETAAGALILLGLFTRFAAIGGLVAMIGAWFFVHAKAGNWNPMSNGGELVLVYIASFLAIKANGSGIFAIDNLCGCNCECEGCEVEAAPVVAAKPAKAAKKKSRK